MAKIIDKLAYPEKNKNPQKQATHFRSTFKIKNLELSSHHLPVAALPD